jgi:hypothetical protein
MDAQIKKEVRLGKIFFVVFVILIAGGIIHKRMFDGPEFMMMWHLPAAVFLVFSGRNIMKSKRRYYYQSIKKRC